MAQTIVPNGNQQQVTPEAEEMASQASPLQLAGQIATTPPATTTTAPTVPTETPTSPLQTTAAPLAGQTPSPGVPVPEAQQLPTPAIDPATGTVEGRVAGIIDKGGALQQVGQTAALQQAQQRGLLNTSMAVGAARKAAIESALPIAQQDAAFYQQQAIESQRGEIEKQLVRAREESESNLTAQRADIAQQLLAAEGTQKASLLAQQGQLDFDLAVERGRIASDLQSELFDINTQLETLKAGFGAADLASRQAHETALTAQRAAIETRMQELIGIQALEQQGLKGEQSAALTSLKSEYDVLMNTQQSATLTFNATSSAISAILANPDIPADAKPGLINQQMVLLDSSLAVMGGISDMDLTGLLDFAPIATPETQAAATQAAATQAAATQAPATPPPGYGRGSNPYDAYK